jgi:Flp pilus assembly protein TadG
MREWSESPIRHRKRRRGATLVEFAVTSPIVFLMFFAAVEFSRVSMFRHTVENALYEGARAGIVPGATANDVVNRSQAILRSVGINRATVDCIPAVLTNTTPTVTVRIRMALDQELIAAPFFFRGKSIDRSFEMQREVVR